MSRIVPHIHSLKQHLDTLSLTPRAYRPSRCPHCGVSRVWSHGVYVRKANRSREPGLESTFVPIPRFICHHCQRTCSMVPQCLPPRRWYLWERQHVLLRCLLMGASIREASARIEVDRRTGRRWWNWLLMRGDAFAFFLKERMPDLGRTVDLMDFWRTCLEGSSLSFAMCFLDDDDVIVP